MCNTNLFKYNSISSWRTAFAYLEVTAAPYHSQRPDKDDCHDEDEDDAGDVGVPTWHPEHPGHRGEHPVDVAPLLALSAVLSAALTFRKRQNLSNFHCRLPISASLSTTSLGSPADRLGSG